MPIQRLGKARESLTFSGEEYKRLVREYLESQGFGQISDSFVEGHLMDLIMVNPNISLNKKYWIECKNSDISPNDEKFVAELISYFLMWWENPEKEDIDVRVYVAKIVNVKELEKIISKKHGKKLVPNWLKKAGKTLDKEKLALFEKIPEKSQIEFFQNLEIIEADMEFLRRATKENLKRNNFSLQKYAENLLVENRRKSLPIKQKTTLILNLLTITYPSVIYRAISKLPKKEGIFLKFNQAGIEIPPITFYPAKSQISSFCPFGNSNPLTEVIDKKSITILNLSNDEVSQQNVHAVLNQHLKRIFWKKGLSRIPNTNTYYFQIEPKNDILYDKYVEGEKGQPKQVAHVYRKPEESDLTKVNYVFHHAAEIKPFSLWGKTYLEIVPRKLYSSDGKTLLVGKEKSRLDAYFRNPIFNRNQAKLVEIKFWKEFIRRNDNYLLPEEEWFTEFKIGDIKQMPFDWKPSPVEDLEQTKIGEFEQHD